MKLSLVVILGFNKVLVRPDADHVSVSGFLLPCSDEQKHIAITGTVIAVGSQKILSLPNSGDRLSKLIGMAYAKVNVIEEKIDIKPGDSVVFSYSVHYDCRKIGSDILMGLDRLYLVERNGVAKSVNQCELIQMVQKDRQEEIADGIYWLNVDLNHYGIGVSRYGKYKGQVVFFDKRHCRRLELDFHNTMTDSQSSLFHVKTKDIQWTLPN